jgi:ATP-dependent Clp protease protease subunit
MRLHDPEFLDLLFAYGLDTVRRRVYLHYPIEVGEKAGTGVIEHVVKGINHLDRAGTGHIELWICTPGGEVSEMFALYDVIRACETEIWTVGFGEVCSAGALLLVAGDRRFATENCFFMAHNCSGGVGYDVDIAVAESQVRATRRIWDRWAKMMARHTAHSQKWWTEKANEKCEMWFSAEQMAQKQHRVVDEIWKRQE